jgi:hypothetical protein
VQVLSGEGPGARSDSEHAQRGGGAAGAAEGAEQEEEEEPRAGGGIAGLLQSAFQVLGGTWSSQSRGII